MGGSTEAFAARFELHEEVGRGGMGVVHRATDRSLGRPVAIKFLAPSLRADEASRRRLRKEARAIARIRHPNVVRLLDVDRSEACEFLVLEWIDGESLERILRRGGAPLPALLGWLERVARGVQAAHEHGIVHRDLKPANVLVATGGVPKVVDFGIAHLAGTSTTVAAGSIGPGTPLYMAPELLGDPRAVSARTDVYALGAILYRVLTGRPPHEVDDPIEFLERARTRDPIPPRRLDPRIPPEIEAVALTALARDPARRHASAGELAEALAALSGESTVAVSARAPRPRSRPRSAVTAATALLAAGLIAAAAVLALRGGDRSDPLPEAFALLEQARPALTQAESRLRDPAGTPEGLQESLARAEERIREALRLAPDLASAHYLLGRCLESQGALREAEARYASAAGLDERSVHHHVALARIRWSIHWLELIGIGITDDCEPGLTLSPGADPEGWARVEAAAESIRAALAASTTAPDPIDAALGEALMALERQDGDEFDSVLAAAIERYPTAEGAEVLYWLSHLVHSESAALARGLRLAPNHPLLLLARGLQRIDVEPAGALADLDRAILYAPRLAQAHVIRSAIRGVLEDWSGALEDGRRAVEIDPGVGGGREVLAEALLASGDHDGGIAMARAALEARPGSALARIVLASAMARRGDEAGARGELAHLTGEDAPTAARRAEILRAIGDLAAARAEFDRAIRLDPRPTYIHARVVLAMSCGDWEAALEDLCTLESIRTNSVDLANRSYVEFNLKRPHESIRYAEGALAIDPGSVRALLSRALSSSVLGDWPRANSDLRAVLAIDPREPEAWRALGLLHQKDGRHSEALEALSRCVELRPGDSAGWLARSMSSLALGDLDGAQADVDRAFELAPGWFLGHFQRGLLARRRGDVQGAIRALEEALRLCPPDDERRGGIEALLEEVRATR